MENAGKSLMDLISLGRTVEAVSKQIREMNRLGKSSDRPEENLNKIDRAREVNKNGESSRSARKCYKCNGIYPHVDRLCPALGKLCHICKESDHFARCCRNKQARQGKSHRTNASTTNTRELVSS